MSATPRRHPPTRAGGVAVTNDTMLLNGRTLWAITTGLLPLLRSDELGWWLGGRVSSRHARSVLEKRLAAFPELPQRFEARAPVRSLFRVCH